MRWRTTLRLSSCLRSGWSETKWIVADGPKMPRATELTRRIASDPALPTEARTVASGARESCLRTRSWAATTKVEMSIRCNPPVVSVRSAGRASNPSEAQRAVSPHANAPLPALSSAVRMRFSPDGDCITGTLCPLASVAVSWSLMTLVAPAIVMSICLPLKMVVRSEYRHRAAVAGEEEGDSGQRPPRALDA